MGTRTLRLAFRAALAACLLAALPVKNALAIPVTVEFAGELDRIGGNFDPSTQTFDGFGLSLDVGDDILGSFTYDSDSGIAQSFAAKVGHLDLVASNLVIGVEPFDGFLGYFYILGELDNGLFMSVGLTNGGQVFTGNFPTSLSSDDWFLSAFKISADRFPPIEIGSAPLGTTGATNLDGPFAVRTVPEPSSRALLVLGLLAVGLTRRTPWIARSRLLYRGTPR